MRVERAMDSLVMILTPVNSVGITPLRLILALPTLIWEMGQRT
jgi:hypothetical protein